MKNSHINNLTLCAVLVSVGIILGYLESLFSIVPIQGVKIGFSNIILLYGVLYLNNVYSYSMAIVKTMVIGLVFTGVMSILYSLPSAMAAVFIMDILNKRVDKKLISVYGISIMGSVIFNVFQFLVASLVLKSVYVLIHLWYVLPLSVLTGFVTAVIFHKIIFKEAK